LTEHKTMNTIIHAAFRRDLGRFDAALADFPAGSQPRADQLFTAWQNYAAQLHHHHSDEETIFFPALRELGADETLISTLDGEHEAMLAALAGADAAMKALHAEPSADNAAGARAAITNLQTVLVAHLEHEERDLEPFAASKLSTPQAKQAQVAVRKAHKGNAGTFMAWLADGADPDASAALRHEIPAPVLFMLTRVAGRRYNREIAPVWAS
jgi:iron-sulfur cluster repair protein YtfE (RIC family)